MSVLALDPNSYSVGWCLWNDDEHQVCGSWDADSKAPLIDRLLYLGARLRRLVTEELSIDLALIETPDLRWQGMPSHPATMEALFGLSYLLAGVLDSCAIACATIDPRVVKKALTGAGNATKQVVQAELVSVGYTLPTSMVLRGRGKSRGPVEEIDEDACDALAIALVYHRATAALGDVAADSLLLLRRATRSAREELQP